MCHWAKWYCCKRMHKLWMEEKREISLTNWFIDSFAVKIQLHLLYKLIGPHRQWMQLNNNNTFSTHFAPVPFCISCDRIYLCVCLFLCLRLCLVPKIKGQSERQLCWLARVRRRKESCLSRKTINKIACYSVDKQVTMKKSRCDMERDKGNEEKNKRRAKKK